MKKKGPYKVVTMQKCMDWCNKFKTCSFFSFQKTKKLCYLFEVRYSIAHGYPDEQTSGPKYCSEINTMETPDRKHTSKN